MLHARASRVPLLQMRGLCAACSAPAKSPVCRASARRLSPNPSMLPAVYKLHFHNGGQGPLDQFMVQFNKNTFGLAPATQNIPVAQVAPGASQTAALPLTLSASMLSPAAVSSTLQVGSAAPGALPPQPASPGKCAGCACCALDTCSQHATLGWSLAGHSSAVRPLPVAARLT